MAIENATPVIASALEDKFDFLITIFKVIIGVVGVYLIFWLINLIINIRKNSILRRILENLEQINEKLGKSRLK
ncbi:hypothetical protein HYW74_01875 [Candidatus Pacearchaeota archaeon]|nr:hypothetical protein [Candidatus Pacearchaeota archaeon]